MVTAAETPRVDPRATGLFSGKDDFSWMKDLTVEDVDGALSKIKPSPMRFVEGLRLTQKVGFLIGLSYPQFFFMIDMGGGKTALALRLLSYFKYIGRLAEVGVVLAPTEESVAGWAEQVDLWAIDLPYEPLLGSFEQKWRSFYKVKNGIAIATYIGYATMVSELRMRRDGKSRKRHVSPALAQKVMDRCDALVMDESTLVGEVKSLNYEAVRFLSFAADIRYALAGRPFGRDPMKLWSQFFLVDHGLSLSDKLSTFQSTFFERKKAYWGVNNYEYKFRKALEPELARATAHRSLAYSIHECLDMPPLVPIVRRVSFPEDMEAYHKKLIDTLIKNKGNYRVVENAFMKMRQIASGFLGVTDDDTGEKAQLVFKHNPKLDDLMQLLEEMPQDEKALIVHEFTWSGATISKALTKAKIKHGWLYGGTKDWPTMKKRFDNDPEFRVLLMNHKKGALSLNLQSANWEFIYESPVSPIDREQVERRAWRGGQTKRVMLYDLVVRGSVEEKILRFHKEGQNLFDAIIAEPQLMLAA